MDSHEKSARLIEAASAILRAAPRHRLNAVVLNKALFYLDLVALRDRAASVTGNAFIALQQGPVVARYPERLIERIQSLGVAKQVNEWDGSKPIVLEQCPESFDYLDETALTMVEAVTSYFADVSSSKASEYSHENPGWQLAWNKYRRTGKPCAIDMQIAMQQIIEDDPWMDIPLLDDDEILAAADNAIGTDW